MLNSYISSTRGDASRRILEFYQRHYHAHAVLVAKARFGLYALCRSLFKPGSEIIISPVTCHTVIEALLAAGVSPRFVEIDLMTGNIDVSRLDPKLLRRASGLITTNLYGNPDRIVELKAICDQHDLALIEDCAHVLRSLVDGREVGSFGIASVFSFGKHLGETGGAVVTSDPRLAAAVEQVVRHEAVVPGLRDDALRLVQHRLSGIVPLPAMRTLAALVRPIRGNSAATTGTAAPASPAELVLAALKAAGRGPARMPNTASLCRVADALDRRDLIAAKRLAETEEFMRSCPLPMRLTGREGDNCLLAIPVIHDGRNEVIRQVREKGVPTYFLYNPPMNEAYAGRIAGSPETVLVTPRQWCSNILPVNPRHAGLYLDAINSTSMHACA